MQTPEKAQGPEVLLQLQFAMAAPRVLASALQLGMFGAIAGGKSTADEIAGACSADGRATRMVLDVLVALQLLTKREGRYGLSPLAERHLVRGKPDYIGSFIEDDRMWESWGKLPEVVRTGQPLARVDDQRMAEQFFPVLIENLHIVNRAPAQRTAAALALAEGRAKRVLDVACGSAVWSIAAAEACPQARCTAQDFPGVLDHTRRYVARAGLEARFDYLSGDLNTVDFGSERFDLALLGNIVHSEGEASSRALFGKLAKALAPGGRIAIVDMVPVDDRSGPPFPLIFALNMLLHTTRGDTYTKAEYGAWLAEAGFGPVETFDIGSHSPLLVATRR